MERVWKRTISKEGGAPRSSNFTGGNAPFVKTERMNGRPGNHSEGKEGAFISRFCYTEESGCSAFKKSNAIKKEPHFYNEREQRHRIPLLAGRPCRNSMWEAEFFRAGSQNKKSPIAGG